MSGLLAQAQALRNLLARTYLVEPCRIERPGAPTRTPLLGTTRAPGTVVSTRCRYEEARVETTVNVQGVVERVDALIYVPTAVEVDAGDTITLDDSGESFRVLGVSPDTRGEPVTVCLVQRRV